MLVITASRIGSSLEQIADFLQIDTSLLDHRRTHLYKANYESTLYDHLPLGYTTRLIARHCGDDVMFAD